MTTLTSPATTATQVSALLLHYSNMALGVGLLVAPLLVRAGRALSNGRRKSRRESCY
jgi:hypothetical protein